MALFTDGPISSIEDLRGHDTQIVEIASVEGIDVTKKLALAQEEVAIDLMALLGKLTMNRAGPVAGVGATGPGSCGGDGSAEAVAHVSLARDGVSRCVSQPVE